MVRTAEEMRARAEQKARVSNARQYFAELSLESIPSEEARNIVTVVKNLATTPDNTLSNDYIKFFPEAIKGKSRHPLYKEYQKWVKTYKDIFNIKKQQLVLIHMAYDHLNSNFSPELTEPLAQALVYGRKATNIETARARIAAEHLQAPLSLPAAETGNNSTTPPRTPSSLLDNEEPGSTGTSTEPLQNIQFGVAVTAIQDALAAEKIQLPQNSKGVDFGLRIDLGLNPYEVRTVYPDVTPTNIRNTVNFLNVTDRLKLDSSPLTSIIERATTTAQQASGHVR